jgi:flagellar basal body-associated protein FliL
MPGKTAVLRRKLRAILSQKSGSKKTPFTHRNNLENELENKVSGSYRSYPQNKSLR